MVTFDEQRAGNKALRNLEAKVNTLMVINDHGDLCRDGLRAVNFIRELTDDLIVAIEQDEGVEAIADALYRAILETKST